YELYLDRPQDVRISRKVFQTASTIANEVAPPKIVTSEPLYEDDETTRIDASRSQHIVTIPISDFQLGQYLVRVSVEDGVGNTLDVAEESFTVDWKGLAEHIKNIDDAISQLIYIAQPREIRHLKDGATGAERLSRFVDFWRKRDPTPGTRRNERMEEYYYRVSHANERYGTLTDGWKTDRGEVVVLFGEPDYIERHPYNFNVEPYEIWYYYRIGKRFIFVDRTGLGDYEILIPHWDERTRIR
ncbi:MAG: GWxTD domain-containing protein, partial [Rhodothermales bacterium]|nr:GWxTD domain-containing protein [Rhodothermales bacterium]